jgi:hypothetical protein
MINVLTGSVKRSNTIFYEGFLNIWTIKIITTLIGFFDNSADGGYKFTAFMSKQIFGMPYGGNK